MERLALLGNADVARRARNREDAQTTCGGVSGATACAAATNEVCAVRCPVRLGYGSFVSAGCECGLFGERLVERSVRLDRVLVERSTGQSLIPNPAALVGRP